MTVMPIFQILMRPRWRLVLAGLFSGGLLLALTACSQSKPLQVGIHPWLGYQPLQLAEQNGLLPKSVELQPNRTALETQQGLASGELDAGYLTLDEVLGVIDQGTPLKVVLVADISAGADRVISQQPITGREDIIGKTIVYEKGAVGELMLAAFLEHHGVMASEVTLKNVPYDAHLAHWKTHRPDFIISFDPVAMQVLRAGGVSVFDSRAMPETIVDVLAVRESVLGENCDAIQAMVKAHFAGLNLIKQNFQDASYQIADNLGLTQAEVVRSLGGLSLPSYEMNQKMLMNGFSKRVTHVAETMVAAGLLSKVPTAPLQDGRCL